MTTCIQIKAFVNFMDMHSSYEIPLRSPIICPAGLRPQNGESYESVLLSRFQSRIQQAKDDLLKDAGRIGLMPSVRITFSHIDPTSIERANCKTACP